MSRAIERLAEAHGILTSYRDFEGRTARPPEAALRALLKALGVDPDKPNGTPKAEALPVHEGPKAPEDVACYLPPFLAKGRAWGISCQVYSLRSHRNWGMGDFEDMACMGEIAASYGADFLGVNPLNALFLAKPEAASPFSPSDQNHLNPLYIAVDKVEGFDPGSDADADTLAALRLGDLIDYRAVAKEKLRALRRIHTRARANPTSSEETAFIADGGEALKRYALFESLSLHMAASGYEAGWFSWPDAMQDPDSSEVAAFARSHAEEIDFQCWLQWIAYRQLAGAADRLRSAGMRIGLYLDLAVGTAPDGAATWSDRALTVVGAEIGAPPDMFNLEGQSWGLAPISPSQIVARDFEPVRRSYQSVIRHGGALRIDHAMSLHRLFWIPAGFSPRDGAYVIYPMEQVVRALAEVSQEHKALIVGEDLGVVPEGFREEMTRARIFGYRLFYFERDRQGFIPPEKWPRAVLACLGSHDTATLAGWWSGWDIEQRESIGLFDADYAEKARKVRAEEKRQAISLLRAYGLDAAIGETFDAAVAAAVHRLVARTPSRLMVAQLEDLLGMEEQVNIPGTVDEHPNWRRRHPSNIEDFEHLSMPQPILRALADERPRSS